MRRLSQKEIRKTQTQEIVHMHTFTYNAENFVKSIDSFSKLAQAIPVLAKTAICFADTRVFLAPLSKLLLMAVENLTTSREHRQRDITNLTALWNGFIPP